MSDTIAAISTAQGAGGIGVIRISGKEAKEIADRVFRSPTGKKLKKPQDIPPGMDMYRRKGRPSTK